MDAEPKRQAAEALFAEGNGHMQRGELARAESCFLRAVQIAPRFAGGHANLGFVLDRRGETEQAEACYRRSLELDQGYAETHLNLGALLANRKQFHEAEMAYASALMLRPGHAAAWSNLGVLYACTKREREAEACYRTAMNLDPRYDNARFNLSYLLLRQGAFEEGWACFESRDWYAAFEARVACPRWEGQSLAGKSLLIGYEGGHGDMIQFCRYAALVKAHGASRIAIVCHPALKSLFAQLADIDLVTDFDAPMPTEGWDFWTPPMSIPFHLKTRAHSIPVTIPYLHASPDAIAKWSGKLATDGVRIGIAWKGNPRFENDADRSLPSLATLSPLSSIAGVTLISLQKGEGEGEAMRPPVGMTVSPLGAAVEDFADMAGLIEQLDLVICVDTAVAHLAGAMGKACWILLPYYKTDWRWLKDRTDSPWYPRVVRLFRQSAHTDWSDVVLEVRCAVVEFVEARRRSRDGDRDRTLGAASAPA
jgi:Flp pilus assembly protein TadD